VVNKPRERKTIIAEANKNSLFTTIPDAQTMDEKRALVLEQNPHHYAFGEIRRAWKPWLTYEENMAEEFLI
jgi:hypothetical protein